MSLAKTYNRTLKKEIETYGAWFPVTNTFKIGDFGLIENGVFKSIGNIANKYPDIELKIEPGKLSKINFSSSGTKMIKIGASGEVDSFSALGNAEAKLKIQFSGENSIVLKANWTSMHLQNIEEVAMKLVSKSSWKKKYKVVSAIYTGEKCVVICSRESGTEVTLEGRANILKQVEVGKVEGAVSVTSTKKGVFESIGETGIIGLDLFKVRLKNVKILGDIQAEDVIIKKDFEVDLEDDF